MTSSDLTSFFKNPVNSVTRERLFYNRLYYDLKLAAARRGYALTTYEPEVDRDGYDIVIDDGDATRFVQLKTVLKSSRTSRWSISTRFIRPDMVLADGLLFTPMESGKGGAVVLIEIDLSTAEPAMTYYVSDYALLRIMASVMGSKVGKGSKILGKRRETATKTWLSVHSNDPKHKILLTKGSFFKARDAAGVLGLLGLHSPIQCSPPAIQLLQAIQHNFRVEDNGSILIPGDLTPLANARQCAEEVLLAADEPRLAVHPTLMQIGAGNFAR